MQDDSFWGDTKVLEVKIVHVAHAMTISITDTDVGVSKAALINKVGAVAKSGTTNFLEAMAEDAGTNLIGRSGVGFYSAILVADNVRVMPRCTATGCSTCGRPAQTHSLQWRRTRAATPRAEAPA